ncbi:3-isopropylmalate dehydratase small subunit [Chloroflexota bacterium]
MLIRGRVWQFGDNVNTDVIAPTVYHQLPMDEFKMHAMEVIRPEFALSVQPGDIIGAGINFGCGSSREVAPAALKALGVGAVVAESFGRIFFRNAIAIGLPIISCPQVSASFNDGDEMEINLDTAAVTNVTRGKTLRAVPLPGEMLEVLVKGGIAPLLKEIAKRGAQV